MAVIKWISISAPRWSIFPGSVTNINKLFLKLIKHPIVQGQICELITASLCKGVKTKKQKSTVSYVHVTKIFEFRLISLKIRFT